MDRKGWADVGIKRPPPGKRLESSMNLNLHDTTSSRMVLPVDQRTARTGDDADNADKKLDDASLYGHQVMIHQRFSANAGPGSTSTETPNIIKDASWR